MNFFTSLLEKIPLIEDKLGYLFFDKRLLALAFVHRSFFNENRTIVEQHNERLEFLGDSVLGVIISDYVYNKFPGQGEGHLSHLKAHLVEANTCASYVQKIGVAEFVLLGKGERLNEGRGRESIYADLFEAIIGAIYLDGGLDAARGFFLVHFEEEMQALFQEPVRNYKAELQDHSQRKYQKPPVYKVIKEKGPDHARIFVVAAYLADQEVGLGEGSSKKQAEQAAAEDALGKLGRSDNGQTETLLELQGVRPQTI